LPVEIKRKRDKKVLFQYDINDRAPEPEFDDEDDDSQVPDLSEYEAADLEESDDQGDDDHGNEGSPKIPAKAASEVLRVASNELDDDSDSLAYGNHNDDTDSEDV
jgi:hypothetical protein